MYRENGLTPKKNCVIGLQKKDDTFLNEVDHLFDNHSEGAFVLGQHPVLSTGMLSMDDYVCLCPPLGALAVSKGCYETIGNIDKDLGWAAATDYLYRLKRKEYICGTAYNIKAPSFVTYPEDITKMWIDGLLLDYKHGTAALRKAVIKRLCKAVFSYDISIGNYSRKTIISNFLHICRLIIKYRILGEGERSDSFQFMKNTSLRGSFYVPELKTTPLVSVIVRTHKRPEVLRKTLELLREQTYKNYEIVLVEDGEPTSEHMVYNEFADLPIRYVCTRKPIGRSAAANLGFSLAKGKYCNLLDDDDYLFPEHLETAVSVAENKKVDIVFLQDLSLAIEKTSEKPYKFEIREAHFMNFPRIDPFTMSHLCATPDNGVFFRKEVLSYTGGMREDLDANEDWALWLRMMTKATYTVVRYATCCFVVPFNEREKEERNKKYSVYNGMQLNDDFLKYETSGEQIREYYCGVINDFNALSAKGQLEDYLKHELRYWNVINSEEYIHFAEIFKEKSERGESGTYTAEEFVHFYLGMIAKKQKEIAKN